MESPENLYARKGGTRTEIVQTQEQQNHRQEHGIIYECNV